MFKKKNNLGTSSTSCDLLSFFPHVFFLIKRDMPQNVTLIKIVYFCSVCLRLRLFVMACLVYFSIIFFFFMTICLTKKCESLS